MSAVEAALDETLAIDPDGRIDQTSFLQLASDTYDWASARGYIPGVMKPFEEDFEDYVRLAARMSDHASTELSRRWRGWRDNYPLFAAAHPKLEMLSIMSALSESIFGCGWMTADENVLKEWVDQESHLPLPAFMASGGWIADSIHQRLKELRRRTRGWLFLDENLNVVFLTDKESRRIRETRRVAEKKRQEDQAFHEMWLAARSNAAGRLLSLARADSAGWNALKVWEMENEAAYPTPDLQTFRLVSTGTKEVELRAVSYDEIEARDVDADGPPLLRHLIEKATLPGERFPTIEAIWRLRRHLRLDLGLNANAMGPWTNSGRKRRSTRRRGHSR